MKLLIILFCCLYQTQPSTVDLSSVVVKSFSANHDGYSSDEVLLNDELNQRFIVDCQKQLPGEEALRFNWTLINLRKAGKLSHIETTKRNRKSTSEYRVLAEIVARTLLDTEKVSLDRIFANPRSRKAFDEKTLELNADADLYLVRKAAFQLRKARRLRPELITRIADWGREIDDFKISEVRNDPTIIPESPGIYIFRDTSGYLYIGQSGNLRDRLIDHLDESSNTKLAIYLNQSKLKKASIEIHSFQADSQAKNIAVRRAYESELIRSRKPKFNILP